MASSRLTSCSAPADPGLHPQMLRDRAMRVDVATGKPNRDRGEPAVYCKLHCTRLIPQCSAQTTA